MEDDLYPYFSEDIDNGYHITEILYDLILDSAGNDLKTKQLNLLVGKLKNRDIINRYIDLLRSIEGEKIRGFIDVNDGNFGYNKEGKLKMLDI
jgi:hypothetical protein